MKRKLTHLLVLAMIATMLAACGKKTEETEVVETVEMTETIESEPTTEESVPETTEPTTELSDLDNDISITGDLGSATDAMVKAVDTDTETDIKALVEDNLKTNVTAVTSFDITIIDADDNEVQPDGTVIVTIPISEEMDAAEGDTYAVYHYTDNAVESMKSEVMDDAIVFQTTHFSVYSVVKYTEPVAETEEEVTEPESVVETKESEPAVSEPEPQVDTTEPVTTTNVNETETVVLPGENRNGRYADIPESVLPASEAPYMSFYDEPVKATCWIDNVKGTIYADYARTQIIKEVTYDVDGYNDILYVIGTGDRDCRGTALAIYNGQYVIINEALFDFWYNGKSSAFD